MIILVNYNLYIQSMTKFYCQNPVLIFQMELLTMYWRPLGQFDKAQKLDLLKQELSNIIMLQRCTFAQSHLLQGWRDNVLMVTTVDHACSTKKQDGRSSLFIFIIFCAYNWANIFSSIRANLEEKKMRVVLY